MRGEENKDAIALLADVIPASKHTNSLGNKTNEVLCVILEKKMTAKQKIIIFVGSEKMVHTPNGKNSPRSFLRKKGKERQKDQSSSIRTAIVHAREG